MGFFDVFKGRGSQLGLKAYRMHVSGLQMRQQGKYVEAKNKLDEAFEMYHKAYEAGFRKPAQLLAYAILTMQCGHFERARELMLEVSKDKELAREDRFTLRVNFAICQWKMGRLDKAIETIRLAAGEKVNGAIYTTLGMFLVEKARETGDFEEALRFNQEALDYDDEDAAVLDNLGQLYLIMSDQCLKDGNREQAEQWRETAYRYLVKAHDEKGDQVTSIYYLAILEHERGNDKRARELIEERKKYVTTALCPISDEEFAALKARVS